ncbi:helix-turn-helix domain-containing protein [Nonomuraea dietziae]|uniref:helix-turn-helix domain-containing protein n=1 Tax=Nonomuraea dietziae TaxID=65515 RepID=UPI0033E6C6FD
MHDIGLDGEPIGARIAHVRKLRGLTQNELAQRVPCSKSLIAQVERGHKPATPSLVAAVARAVNVDVTELTGQPYRGRTARTDRIHATVSELRQALVYGDVPPDLETPARNLEDLETEVIRIGKLRQAAQYVELGTVLPGLIQELTYSVHELSGPQRARAFGLLSHAFSAADSMVYKLGYLDLFHVAVQRMTWAAEHADDAMLKPVSDVRRSMAFMATGAWDGGLRLLDRTSRRLEDGQRTGNSTALSVYGTVQLRAAILAARGNRSSAAWAYMQEANETAKRLQRDTNDYGLFFGPSNVAIHDVAVAVELGDADEAIRRGATLTLAATVPAERASHHYIDLSRAWLWAGKRDKALGCVLTAETIAPQRTRYHPMARETVGRLLDVQRRIPENLRGVASRMGLGRSRSITRS